MPKVGLILKKGGHLFLIVLASVGVPVFCLSGFIRVNRSENIKRCFKASEVSVVK